MSEKKELNLEELTDVTGGTYEYRGVKLYTIDEAYDLSDGTEVKVYEKPMFKSLGTHKIHSHAGKGPVKIVHAGNNGQYTYINGVGGSSRGYVFGPVD